MGRDCYKIHNSTGVGFSVTVEQYHIYKHLLGEKYGCLIYCEPDSNCVVPYIYIYDKETIAHNTITINGPEGVSHSTELFDQTHISKFFQKQIDEMNSCFDLHEGECSYCCLMTTLEIGELERFSHENEKYPQIFVSIDDYCDYYGYDRVIDDE